MAQKGLRTKSEALDLEEFYRLLDELHGDRKYIWELYCLVSFYLALRVSDVRKLTWTELLGANLLVLEEQKTKKERRIPLAADFKERVLHLYKLLNEPEEDNFVFSNGRQIAGIYTSQYINQQLKIFKWKYTVEISNFSTHSFRKTFGRAVWEAYGKTEEALFMLCRYWRHSAPSVTMAYLGIRETEILSIYDTIKIPGAAQRSAVSA